MQQSPSDIKDLGSIPDEELFHRALAQINSFGQQAFQLACRQRDLIQTERARSQRENDALRKRIAEKDSELETLRKSLIDAQMELAESRRSENSFKLEAKQYKEQLSIYAVDARRIEEAEKQLRAARGEISDLRSQIEAAAASNAKTERDRKAELEKMTLKHEQEKVQLHESIQVAEERAQNAADAAERFQSAMRQVEAEKNVAAAEFAHGMQSQKQVIEKLRSDLAQREASASELERSVEDIRREYERKIALTRSQTEQGYQTQIESLKNELEERTREISRFRYQLEQEKEYHRRATESLKQEMAKQIDLRADEIRRQLILKSAGIASGDNK